MFFRYTTFFKPSIYLTKARLYALVVFFTAFPDLLMILLPLSLLILLGDAPLYTEARGLQRDVVFLG
jgi:hypothetical protein